MKVKKGKGKKKNKTKKIDILESILASVEKMSAKLVKLEDKVDSFKREPRQRAQKVGPGAEKSTVSPGTGGGRSQRAATKKATTRKKSVAGRAAGKKVVTKKALVQKTTARKKVTGKKAVASKKTAKRRTTARKVVPEKTRARR